MSMSMSIEGRIKDERKTTLQPRTNNPISEQKRRKRHVKFHLSTHTHIKRATQIENERKKRKTKGKVISLISTIDLRRKEKRKDDEGKGWNMECVSDGERECV
jgi:predicted N-formylglutamate amidohydrolase